MDRCEYVVILPSAWDYLQTLGVTEEYWLGFIISIYSFAAALAGVIGGRLADKYYQHTKAIVVGSIVFRAIGNFLYMLGISKWYILSGRLLCGMGTAAGTALMAEEESNIYKKYMDEFLTDSFVLLMSMLFALYFSPMCFETVIPIITQDYFGFSVNEITFIYMAGGIESVVTFAVVALIGKYVRETTLQIVGLFLMLIAEVWLIVVMPNFEKGNPTHVIYFLGGIFLIYLGSPIASIANTALSSKVLSNETQGLGQGIRRLVGYLGLILAPTWAGSSVKMPYLFLGVCLALLTFNAIMLLVSCRGLRKKEDDILESSRQNLLPEDEVTPLLRCEYVVILPSAWDYLQTLGVTEEHWLGFIISIYSFAAALAGGLFFLDVYYVG
ncbi:unnamed protein product [Allacma fusca]|uniref:Major facilitator superfamily (MFS) profile domain-containing protein n=1 Tax=Allacma fusca TaxID=39272 RepID=A0A8J2P5A1_9HEXA|nr:unnamed protein product [Allacma fusca]